MSCAPALAARMEPKDAAKAAAEAAATLTQAMKDTKNVYQLPSLAQSLTALGAHDMVCVA